MQSRIALAFAVLVTLLAFCAATPANAQTENVSAPGLTADCFSPAPDLVVDGVPTISLTASRLPFTAGPVVVSEPPDVPRVPPSPEPQPRERDRRVLVAGLQRLLHDLAPLLRTAIR
jgi:hypothetical protein